MSSKWLEIWPYAKIIDKIIVTEAGTGRILNIITVTKKVRNSHKRKSEPYKQPSLFDY